MKIKSSYPVIMCDNLPEVAKFYITHFDFEATFSSDWYISLANTTSDTGFELAVLDYRHPTVPFNYREKSKGIIINLEVDDVDGVYEKMIQELTPVLEIKSEDFGQRHFIVSDPAGLLVDVIQVIPPSQEFEAMYQKEGWKRVEERMKNQELAERTKSNLIHIARLQFTEKGYAETSLEEIVSQANVTRGALYHHFGNKLGLFKAVVELVQQELADFIGQEAGKSEDSWEQLVLGCHAFIQAALKVDNRRILLIDGPAVLGWDEWSVIDDRNSESQLLQKMIELKADGLIKEQLSVDALTNVISGSLNEAVLWISHASNPGKAEEEALTVIDVLMEGFRK